MQRHQGQGWAAFDRKQKEKQDSGTECSVEPYPSISKLASVDVGRSSIKDIFASARSFSAVVGPSVGFPPFAGNHDNQIINDNFGAKHHTDQIMTESDVMPVKTLKDTHIWADQNLIEDVLAAVNHDVDQASLLLKAMASSEFNLKDPSLLGPSSSNRSYPCEDAEKSKEKRNLVECKLFDGDHEMVMSNFSFSVPVEPEWEEDDVYLRHRKDAVRMTSIHCASSNAFMRGDHFSAQQYSLKARGEWVEAQKLNAEAAKKILSIRNNSTDIWKIDLHGLHASEAVSALTQHLHRIEMNVETKKKELPEQRPMILHVITGLGNHSRGQASLPTAVKSFLIENGYRFDESRPGVFAVRPKFRNK